MSVVLTTTSETEAGLELLVTVATPDTQQDLVIEGTFQTGIRKAMGKVVFSKLLHSNYFLGGKSLIVCVWSSPLVIISKLQDRCCAVLVRGVTNDCHTNNT